MDKASLSKKACLLQLNSAALADGMRTGVFKSLFHGQGVDFAGVREYIEGDDVRSLDWNVTARMGRPYVKLYEEERELSVLLIVDTSQSMKSSSGKRTRLEVAFECASLLTMASFHNSSPVGAVIFDGKLQFTCPPKSGREQMMLLLSKFDSLPEESENGSALDTALLGAGRILRQRSLVMIFSDFRTTSWIEPFGKLCQRNDVVAVRLVDPLDDTLPPVGTIPFEDSESRCRIELPTSSPRFKRAWSDANYHRVEQWRHECIRHGGLPVTFSTNTEPLLSLTRFFASRER